MTEEKRRWGGVRSAKFALTLGFLWLLFSLLFVAHAVLAETGPLPWITAAIGFVLSLGFFAAALSLRRDSKPSRDIVSESRPEGPL
jgi:uncharacterized membrane protein